MSAAKDLRTSVRQPLAAPPAAAHVAVNSSLPQAQFEEGCAVFNKGRASHPRAVELFRAASDAGHAVATAWLARCYWRGLGVQNSQAAAGRLARVALDERGLQSLADQGDASAQEALGGMYSFGIGVAKDEREGVAWWRKSAEQGYAEAQRDLGCAYREGQGVDKNVNEAAGWFRKSAEQGDAGGQCVLGYAYGNGEGVDHDDREAVVWWRKSAEQGYVISKFALGEAYRDGDGVDKDEDKAVQWFRKAAEQGNGEAQRTLDEWDTALADVTTDWQVIYDPDPRATVVEADKKGGWARGASGKAELVEAYEGKSQQGDGMLRWMSPWVVRCKLNVSTLDDKRIASTDLRRMLEEACHECGCDASVVTSSCSTLVDGVRWVTLRARALADDSTGLSRECAAEDAAAGGGGGAPAAPTHEARELTVCCPDGTSHKLTASPSTTVLEVKQHVLAGVNEGEEESARPFFWQDEHAVQRQHIFVHGVEDELADARSMGSMGRPSALFLMVDTEASFMERLEEAAAALRARLGGVKLRDLARCDLALAAAAAAAAAAAVEGTGAEEAAPGVEATSGSGGAGVVTEGGGAADDGVSGPPCKKRRVQ
jgi:TPR repeat protein